MFDRYLFGISPWVEEIIERYAEQVEQAVEETGLAGDCETSSELWADLLQTVGVRGVQLVRGWYKPHGGRKVAHVWLEIDGNIFDPTGGQFVELEGEEPEEFSYSATEREWRTPKKRDWDIE